MSKNLPEAKKESTLLAKLKAKSIEDKKKIDRSKLEKALEKKPKLLFSMDATASREHSWSVAQQITASMFDVMPGGLLIALAHHGGSRLREVTDYRSDSSWFKDKLQSVRCEAGSTALCEILLEATKTRQLSALIYVGDCFEESHPLAVQFAEELGKKGVPCFMFLEGNDDSAKYTFGEIARITKGALMPFEMNATVRVKERLDAVAAYAAGGRKLLLSKQDSLPAARELLGLLE